MTPRPDRDGSIIGWLAKTRQTCTHGPPRQTTGLPLGITDTCTCGATTYVLRYSGNDGSSKVRKRWDYWKGRRP